MAVTHSTAIRTGIADYVADAHDLGTGANGSLAIRDTSGSPVDLIVFNFQSTAFGAASSGVATLLGTPIATTAAASGTADSLETRRKDGVVILSGTVTGPGGGGDAIISNTSVEEDQPASLTSLTYAAPS